MAEIPIYLDHNATTPILPEVWTRCSRICVSTSGIRRAAMSTAGAPTMPSHGQGYRWRSCWVATDDEVVFTSGARSPTTSQSVAWSRPATIDDMSLRP